jgi:hypothetical protein
VKRDITPTFLGFARKYADNVDVDKRWKEWIDLKPRLSQIMANRIYTRIIETIFYVIKTRYLKVSELKKDDSILKKNYSTY